jgi:SAM-dependent methyltransferase
MLDKTDIFVLEHNRAAAAMWDAGGRAYDEVSFAISDALAHAAQRLAPATGDKVLDIATGTGWTARNCARSGASVTGIDIAPRLLEAARDLSAGMVPAIDYRQADAENLPFEDGAFSHVISTFGIMFAGNAGKAARELARVCKRGGRLVLTAWPPQGAVARFFGVIAEHSGEQPTQASPLDWGSPEKVSALLGDHFELIFETGTNNAYHESEDAIWDWYVAGFGPLRSLHDRLDETGRANLKRDVDRYHEKYRTQAGLRVDRQYLVTIGRRK